MSTFDDFMTAGLATLSAQVPIPTEPFGYGVDFSCTDELSPILAEVDPNSVQAIAEALLRRLITPNGTLIEDQDYGEDVRAFLSHGTTQTNLNTIATKIKNECEKDDRVESVTASSVLDSKTRTLTLSVRVVPQDPTLRQFAMTIAVTSGAAVLEAIS